jgi:hypothetical protein
VVVVARPSALEIAEREGLPGLLASLAELVEKAGIRVAATPVPRAEGSETAE